MTPPNAYLCPIGLEIMKDPVVCMDGHSYERVHIERWLDTSCKSPMTGQTLEGIRVISNHSLRNAIEEWKGNRAKKIWREILKNNRKNNKKNIIDQNILNQNLNNINRDKNDICQYFMNRNSNSNKNLLFNNNMETD